MKFLIQWSRIFLSGIFLILSCKASYAQVQIERKSVVFIQVKCLNKTTGVETKEQGSGFVITKDGFILTAFHVVACNGITGETLERISISGKMGSPYETKRDLDLIKLDAQSDVALLQFRGVPQEYPHLKICRLQKPKPQSSFIAAGFPEGKGFQPVSGIIGNTNAGGGLWSVSSPFHTGMSGGPVMQDGYVVGLIKGGYGNYTSLRKIIPTYLAKSVIDIASNNFLNCPKPYKEGQSFKDCPNCPEVIVIPSGSFLMGSTVAEQKHRLDEGPKHRVIFSKKFAVGVYEVTKRQFKAFLNDTEHDMGNKCWTLEEGKWEKRTGKSYQNPDFIQDSTHPIVCVNWYDAKAYVSWLSLKTGAKYRLLSEAEWEYIARAKTDTPFWWGQSISTNQANYNGNYTYNGLTGINRIKTVSVKSFKPNNYGIYNVHGNVWEWVEDCYHSTYGGAPKNSIAWTDGGPCLTRVIRGGSWYNDPQYLRSASRFQYEAVDRGNSVGFRVAREIAENKYFWR